MKPVLVSLIRWTVAAFISLLVIGSQPILAEDHKSQLLKVFRDEFVELQPGVGQFPATFSMGRANGGSDNERPVRTIHLQPSYSMAKYEVTQELWEAMMGSNPSRWKGPRNSVEMVDLNDAQAFCLQITKAMRDGGLIRDSEEIRLPSEAEWEYAARAGTTTVYSFGNDADQLTHFAWYTENAAGNDPPVGAKQPNAWGLYDMHGYLWEWCSDTYATALSLHPDNGQPFIGQAPANRSTTTDSPQRPLAVVRGGSWKDEAGQLTSTTRRPVPANLRDDAVGLRCVLSPVRQKTTPSADP